MAFVESDMNKLLDYALGLDPHRLGDQKAN